MTYREWAMFVRGMIAGFGLAVLAVAAVMAVIRYW